MSAITTIEDLKKYRTALALLIEVSKAALGTLPEDEAQQAMADIRMGVVFGKLSMLNAVVKRDDLSASEVGLVVDILDAMTKENL